MGTAVARERRSQAATFERLSVMFAEHYRRAAALGPDRFVAPYWSQVNAELARDLLPRPRLGFLRHPLLVETVAAEHPVGPDVEFLETHFSRDRLRAILREDLVGDPLIHDPRYLTSYQSIFDLKHVAEYERQTGSRFADVSRIVEWGGGYGDLAKLLWRLDGPRCHVILDTPLFSCLQWIYLSCAIGEEHVVLHVDPPLMLEEARVNLVPVAFAERVAAVADLFVSTWALSESTRAAQDFVVANGWFGARNLLLAFQSRTAHFPDAERVGVLASAAGARVLDVPGWRGRFYAFR